MRTRTIAVCFLVAHCGFRFDGSQPPEPFVSARPAICPVPPATDAAVSMEHCEEHLAFSRDLVATPLQVVLPSMRLQNDLMPRSELMELGDQSMERANLVLAEVTQPFDVLSMEPSGCAGETIEWAPVLDVATGTYVRASATCRTAPRSSSRVAKIECQFTFWRGFDPRDPRAMVKIIAGRGFRYVDRSSEWVSSWQFHLDAWADVDQNASYRGVLSIYSNRLRIPLLVHERLSARFDRFVPVDRPLSPPFPAFVASDEYFDGQVTEWSANFSVPSADLSPADGKLEDLQVTLHSKNGSNRARARATNGSQTESTFGAGLRGEILECWADRSAFVEARVIDVIEEATGDVVSHTQTGAQTPCGWTGGDYFSPVADLYDDECEGFECPFFQ